MKQLVKNSADEEQVKEGRSKLERKYEQELHDIYQVVSTESGRRVVYKWLQMCGIYRTSFTGNSETYYREGERNIGLKILADINSANPEAYLQMLKEHREREKV